MTPEKWQRLAPLLAKAIELQEEERATLLECLNSEDEQLAFELAALIRAHESRTWSFDEPPFTVSSLQGHQPQFVPGKILLGRFNIERVLGRGGMGEVYEAVDSELGKVAVKTIRPDIAGSPQMMARFREEVKLARCIMSPYVCRIHEIFVLPGEANRPPSAFLTMELLEGRTLADRIRGDGPLPWREAEGIAQGLCEGLQAIHSAGVVHGDLKSHNIMLVSRHGKAHPVIMDFGLAQKSSLAATAFGAVGMIRKHVAGTPDYMAPEQFEGGDVTAATDIYALGVVLYEMVTGKRPFESTSTLGTAVRRAKQPATASSIQHGLPKRWDDAIGRCLRYELTDRFQAAPELAAALRPDHFGIAAMKRTAGTARTHPGIAIALFTFLVALCITSLLWLRQHRYRPPNPEAQRWYLEGVAALREGTYLKAEHALRQAIVNESAFPLAHARLADAYNEMDYYDQAKDELLKASTPGAVQNIPRIASLYLEAIRATVLHDFPAALEDYKTILQSLPASAKADGYVDLGRSYEKVGDLPHAMESYASAEKLAPQYPASFVRVGVLEGRQNHMTSANAAFDTARKLYLASSNYEGLAEIAYQQGSISASNSDFGLAHTQLTQASQVAENLHNAQLKARVLCRLSAVGTASQNYDDALKSAQNALSVAETEDLPYWATEAQIRLSAALIYQNGKLTDADRNAQTALQSAERDGWPLLAADARMALSTVRNRQARPTEADPLAQAALDYYERAGYFTESVKALVLLIRAKRDRAEFADAEKLCRKGLEIEQKSGSPPVMIQFEEAVGTVYQALEKYKDALSHFETAESLARRNQNRLLDYQSVHAADILWRLGRYGDAEHRLSNLSAHARNDRRLASSIDWVFAAMYLSQGRYRDVLKEDSRVQELDPDEIPAEGDILDCLAELSLGSPAEAIRLASRALSNAVHESDELLVARATAAKAQVQLIGGSTDEAKRLAESAQSTFSRLDLWESEWLNLALLSRISTAAKDAKSASDYASKALGILSTVEHNWGTAAYVTYLGRPDVRNTMRELEGVVK